MSATLVSVQVGPVRDLGTAEAGDPMDRPWRSGFYKDPVAGFVRVEHDHVAGDGQADLVNHGGPDKAVLAYSLQGYEAWRGELDAAGLVPGAFGENLTIDGQHEAGVCVGDVLRIGTVTLEVSQPRQPCWKLGRRWRQKALPARVMATGRTGWYFRVREPGRLAAGDAVVLADRPFPGLTIAALNDMMYGRAPATAAAAGCPALSNGWRSHLAGLVE
ncbi:MAG: hypothetical protein JWO31_1871 [Phycisphaerales bacterium]|nr:hypothetical protein [Phycisphaerales bacterium]